MTKEEPLPKFPKWNSMKNDSWNIDRILEWNVKVREKLEKQLAPIQKTINDINSRDESTWGIGTSINLAVLQDKASLINDFLECLK